MSKKKLKDSNCMISNLNISYYEVTVIKTMCSWEYGQKNKLTEQIKSTGTHKRSIAV